MSCMGVGTGLTRGMLTAAHAAWQPEERGRCAVRSRAALEHARVLRGESNKAYAAAGVEERERPSTWHEQVIRVKTPVET